MPKGVVVEFDDAKGYGAVEDAATGERYFFHCTQIADGSRTIAEGVAVEFDVTAGHMGRWEAMALQR
ncbi:MAG TPA: cold shock domain-containing protein [Acidimicrobiales bacterium]|nr:cold shock domain-containing protein [Acidimicrobiales bacterium]